MILVLSVRNLLDWVLQKGPEEMEGLHLHTHTNNFDYGVKSKILKKKTASFVVAFDAYAYYIL